MPGGLGACLEAVKNQVNEAKEWLIDLDAAIGDGDLGLTMSRGFSAIADEYQQSPQADVGRALVRAGMTFNRVAPSTMGTLMATALLRGGKALAGKENPSNEDIVQALEAAIGGIGDRGKSQVGDKTILDVLQPAVEALKRELADGKDLPQAWSTALTAAEKGFEQTANMVSKVGRASWFGEKSVGKHDAGAGLGLVLWRAIQKHFEAGRES